MQVRDQMKALQERTRSKPVRYGIAVLSALAALAVRVLLDPWLGSHAPYVTFMVAVAATVWLAGFWPALLTAALGIPAAFALILPSREPIEGGGIAQAVGVSIYAIGMVAIALLGRSMRQAQSNAQDEASLARSQQASIEQEVTRRKEAESQMHLQAAALEAAANGIVLTDREGKILWANPAFSRMTGYSVQEAIGQTPSVLKSGQHDAAFYENMWKVVLRGEVWHDELVNRRKDGSLYTEEMTITPVPDGNGGIGHFIAIKLDVTDRQRAQAQLRAAKEAAEHSAQELARSNRDLEQYAYISSHDLQEPLRMVSNFVQLLRKRYDSQLDDQARQYIQYAYDGSIQMQQLVNDLLAYSRVNRAELNAQTVSAAACLETAVRNLSLTLAESRAAVTHDPLPMVKADPLQLTQLFQNLLGNAVKFHKEGQPACVHVSAREQDGETVFAVRDEGVGIDPKYHEKVFVIFQRLHARGQYPGTGIGLAICKRIVERHRGRIWLESQPGAGTTVFFSLPQTWGSALIPATL